MESKNIRLDISKSFVTKDEIENIKEKTLKAQELLYNKTGEGNNFLGWIDWPNKYDKEEYEEIKKTADYINKNSDALIVIGIGGSYLGTKAAIEALSGNFYNELTKDFPQIYFAGNNISGSYLTRLLKVIENKDICLNVISKSGTTTEPAIAFRVLKEYIEKKYGKKEAAKRIFITTDKQNGALKNLAEKEEYKTFVIPDNIGGRFSIFTPVGLLPMAVAGINIDKIMIGLKEAFNEYSNKNFEENICCQYAAVRNILHKKNKEIEILVNYEPSLSYISEWWKQLYGESEGKDGKGIFPASVNFSTDLHSMGQYIQDGKRHLFETVLVLEENEEDITIPKNENNLDKLNYLAGKKVNYVNSKALEGTILAHVSGNVPNILIYIPKMNEYYFAKLLYFFMIACGISGYMLSVNPFNQPGVETYKKNMFSLLGKPGL